MIKNCKYELNFEDEFYSFDSEEELNAFLLNNKDKLDKKIKGLNVSASKGLYEQAFTQLSIVADKIKEAIHEADLAGGITNIYDTELDTYVEIPSNKSKQNGYIGITDRINGKKAIINGIEKQIIKTYNREKHIERIVARYVLDTMNYGKNIDVARVLNDEKENAKYQEQKNKIFNDPREYEKLQQHIDQQIDYFEKSNIYGRLIHLAIKVAFEQLQILGYNDFKTKFSLDNFLALNDIAITGVNDRQIAFTNTVLYNMIMGDSNHPGLLKKLQLENLAYVFSEIPIVSSHNGTKLAGVIDLLVVDKEGKVYLYDFKTSFKQADLWANEKHFRTTLQLGYYASMLESKGIKVNDIAYVPVLVSTDKNYKNLTNVSMGDYKSITNTLYGDKQYLRIRKLIEEDIPSDFVKEDLPDTLNLEQIDNFLTKTLNVSYKDKVKKSNLDKIFEERVWKQSKLNLLTGKKQKYFYDKNKEEIVFLPEDKEVLKKIYIESEEKYISDNLGKSLIDRIQNAYDNYKRNRNAEEDPQKRDEIPMILNNNKKRNDFLIKTIGKYRGEEWELLANATAAQLGFMLFYNNVTKVLDIVSVIDENCHEIIKMKYGSSLLGNMYTDANSNVNNDKNILPSTKGNIELMKIMTFINFNENYLNKKGIRIGDLRVISNNYEGTYQRYEILKHNFAKISKAFDLDLIYNLGKDRIKILSPIENLITTVINLEEIRDYKRFGFGNLSEAELFKSELLGVNTSTDLLWEQSKNDIIHILKQELELRISRGTDFTRPTEGDQFTKMIVDLINYYTNQYVPEPEKEIENISLWTNSIKNIDSPLIQATRRILNIAIENIKGKFLKYKENIHNETTNLYESSGFPKIRRYVIGDHSSAFKQLFETTDNKLDSRFILKDPFDKNNSLNETQRTYIKAILELLRERGPNKEFSLEELSKKEGVNWRQIPLIHAKALSLFKNQDYKQWIKTMAEKVYNPLTEVYGSETQYDETGKIKDSKKEFLKVTNFLNAQMNNEIVRNELLQENDVDGWETDLEVVMDIFMLSNFRSEEFDNALPLVTSAKILTIIDNSGVLKDVQPIVDFIDRHLQISVKGERLVKSKTERKIDKTLSVLRQMTSTLNLVFNLVSITRETFNSLYGAMSRAAFHHYGTNTHSQKHLLKLFSIITGESSKDLYSDTNIIESFNVAHGFSNMNLASIIDRASTSKTGAFHFFSNYMQGLNRAPEYMIRMGIFLAELIKDDAWKAYSFSDDQKLLYDWRKDGRFLIYAKGDKSNPEYQKQRGLFLTLIEEFNRERNSEEILTEKDLLADENKRLPAAYTSKQIESLKAYADSILGYYDPESRIQLMSTLFGANFLQFKNWLVASKDKWLLKGQVSKTMGQFIPMKNELEEVLYLLEDGTLTTDSNNGTNLIAYQWEGKWNEGILMSIGRLWRIGKTTGLKEATELFKNDQTIKLNLGLALTDLLTLLLVYFLLSLLFKNKKTSQMNYAEQLLRAIISSPSDVNPFRNFASIFLPNNGWIFPSFGYFLKVGTGLEKVIFDDANAKKWFYSSFGVTRPLQYFDTTE